MDHLRTYARVAAPLLLLVVCTACAAAAEQQPAPGHVAGKLVMEGGPLGPGGKQPGERSISGTVTFTAAGHKTVSVTVGPSGTFSVPLPPGRYQVSGRSPHIVEVDGGKPSEPPCGLASATVTTGQTTSVTLACIVP
jgi:hypothetical protein